MLAERHGISAAASRTSMSREWALFFELRNGTGFGRQERYVDAFAMNLYPSKKHWRVAYEIKVSRSDFLGELKKPEKRQFGFEISNEFWYVCAPGVAKPEEIPQDCGLLEVRGDKLVQKVVARQREARELSLSETAAIARSSCRYDILTSRLWRYQGCELDEQALEELLGERQDAQFHQRMSQRVEEELAARLDGVQTSLRHYAQALQDAGVEPPQWMQRDISQGVYASGWNAEEWVRKHVSPGPNLEEVGRALEALSSAQARIHRTKASWEREYANLEEAHNQALLELRALGRRQADSTD